MMSRVYRALEKAEEEKKKAEKERSPLKVFEEKMVHRGIETTPEKKPESVKGLELPQKEETPFELISLNSFATEEFRKLKTQVFHRLPNPPHSILITSAAPGEGKTTVAIHLAMAISLEIHKKAILIDSDLRKPGIYFDGLKNSKGLSDYLSNQVPLSSVLMESGTENLQVILSGPSSSKSTELIGSKRMGELLTSLKGSGDSTYIIIDSSPIISTSEPALLSKLVDGIILVILADRTPRETVQRAIKSIDSQKILGIVLNQVDLKGSSYYSKYYYKYYHK
jgi:capsular exopolysaccharide synthesis family protein